MKNVLGILLVYVLPIPLIVISLMIGSTGMYGVSELYDWLFKGYDSTLPANEAVEVHLRHNILFNIRLPRILITYFVGAALAASGGVLQGIFRNPLVDPYIMGISSGAAFGASLAILIPFVAINLAAFISGTVAVLLTFYFAYSRGKTSIVALVLSGMIVSGIFTAGLTLVQYISDPNKLQAIVQWTMGNLHTASWAKVRQAVVPIAVGLLVMYALRWKLNVLALGDDESRAVGVHPMRLKIVLIGATTLVTAAAVAAVGVISLYGLIVPHITRMLFGADNIKNMVANILLGGSLLLVIDGFSRVVLPYEIPIGVFTMIIGAPFFILLMKRNKINWV